MLRTTVIRLIVAVGATAIAFMQNRIMLQSGMKELAIFSFPLAFTGFLLAEIAAIWAWYFWAPRFLRDRHGLAFAGWGVLVLLIAEAALPASSFTTWVRQRGRANVLDAIEHVGTAIEALASDQGGSRFALTYTLKFPKTGHYLTFPAYLGPAGDRVFGNYFTKEHPEYYDESHVFESGLTYSFTVVFNTSGKTFDFLNEIANIQICDGKDYFMVCRTIAIGLTEVAAALAVQPPPVLPEPAVAPGNVRSIAEKSIRLDRLAVTSAATKAGQPLAFSFGVTNIGSLDVAIPHGNFGNVISVSYGWEPVSESAKTTKVMPGIFRFGNAIAAGGAQFGSSPNSSLRPGEKVEIQDKITPYEPLVPGEYRLHVYLFSRYSTDTNRPVQQLVESFTIVPDGQARVP